MHSNQNSNDRKQDEKAIRSLEATYDLAWHDGNIEAIVACLTEDSVVVNPLGQVARGRTEFKKMLGDYLGGPLKGSKHKSQILHVDFIRDDVAIVDGLAVIDSPASTDHITESYLNHRFTDIVVKRNNVWAIAHIRAYMISDENKSKI